MTHNLSAMNNTIDHWLRSHAETSPDHIALNFSGTDPQKYSYQELHAAVQKTAAVLQHDLGLTHGERVAFYGKNSDEALILIFAAAALGLIFVPLNWRLAPRELHYIVQNAGVRTLFYDPTFAGQVPEILATLPHVQTVGTSKTDNRSTTLHALRQTPKKTAIFGHASIDDPFLIVYTSGTTGRPKGAVHTQKSVQFNAYASVDAFDLDADDHILTFLPLFHVGGINIQTLPTLFVGGTVTLAEQFSPDIFIAGVRHTKITSVTVVPTILRALLALEVWPDLDISSLKCMAIGSTDVPPSLIEQVHRKNVPVVQVYGATETGPVTIYQKAPLAFDSVGSIGQKGLNSDIRLVANNVDVALGEPGEIWVKAPNCFSHYWQNDTQTHAAFDDGWFKTGDVAACDENGFYWFCDRQKNIIISGGENIYPAEIERILHQISGIAEAAVVGHPDEKWGEVPVAVIKATKPLPEKDIFSYLKDRIAKFKQPKSLVFVDDLPKNAMGKIQYAEVKKLIG